ncbi:MAG: cell division protein ZapB [Pirellulales bacterium]|nr:cell division protein ZapB [Pirellulales bacterium]
MSQPTCCRKTLFPCAHTLCPPGVVILFLCLCGGCLVPASRMETCQARYHQLSEKNKALQTEVANLEAQCSKLQTERNQSEQELVFLDKEVPVLFAKQRKLSQPPPTAGQQLAALADRTEGLDFDAKSGAISLTPAVFFRAGTELKVEAGDRLGTLATVLSEPDVCSHRILIVTNGFSEAGLPTNQKHLQRAITLMEFFRQWGIDKNRLGVSNYGRGPQSGETLAAESLPQFSGESALEIYLLGDDVPIIGWNAPQVRVYR